MWIIPKNLKTKNSHIYHCAQDTEALTLDYSELSEMCEQSLMWRSKPSQSVTWLRRWKTDLLSQHLFGRILKPSLGKCLMEKWTSCQVASLVSHSVQPVEETETKTQGTSFPTSRKEYENVDLPLFSWKMLKESYQANSKDKTGQILSTHRFCYTSLESWKGWVTKQRLAYSQRVKRVHHINVNESSFLVSAMNSPNQALIMSPNSSQEASQEEQLTQQEGENSNIGMNRQGLPWGTPTVSQEIRERGQSYQSALRRVKLKKHTGLQAAITLDNQKFIGNLNPRWVEMLMGLPIGWTVPTCTNPVTIEPMNLGCLGMELYPIQQKPPSLQCGKNWGTPTTLDSKEHSMKQSYKPRKNGKSRKGEGVARQVIEGFNESLIQGEKNYPTPNARDWKDGIGTVPPSVNKTRGYSLGQAIAEDLNKEALKLSKKYNNCILGTENGFLVYSQSCIIDVLYKEKLDSINNHKALYCEEESPEEQALTYAHEMFYHNIDCYQKNGPIIKDDLDHES